MHLPAAGYARCLVAVLLSVPVNWCGTACADEGKLFVATPLTQPGEFTPGIEGPQCDRDGNIYAVNFGKQQTIGKVSPTGKGEIFLELPGKSTGNGIVFDRHGKMLIAD